MHFTEKSCTILTQPSIIFMTPINSLAFVEALRKVFEHREKSLETEAFYSSLSLIVNCYSGLQSPHKKALCKVYKLIPLLFCTLLGTRTTNAKKVLLESSALPTRHMVQVRTLIAYQCYEITVQRLHALTFIMRFLMSDAECTCISLWSLFWRMCVMIWLDAANMALPPREREW